MNKLERGVSELGHAEKERSEQVEVSSQLGRNWEKLLLEYFENEMRAPLSAKLLMTNPFTRTECQLLVAWCQARVSLQDLISCNTLTLGDKGIHVYRMMTLYAAGEHSGLSLAGRKDATCFMRLIMSVILDVLFSSWLPEGKEEQGIGKQSIEHHSECVPLRRD